MRSFDVKVNRKARRAALRGALSHHAGNGTLAVLDAGSFEAPSTKQAAALIDGFELATPIVLVCSDDEANLAKSFRNLGGVAVVQPSELEVAAVVWARSLLVSEAALPIIEGRAR
jgi:large subunit ribosomal protein L4